MNGWKYGIDANPASEAPTRTAARRRVRRLLANEPGARGGSVWAREGEEWREVDTYRRAQTPSGTVIILRER